MLPPTGHNLGFQHASYYDPVSNDYTDYYDQEDWMSAGYTETWPYREFSVSTATP